MDTQVEFYYNRAGCETPLVEFLGSSARITTFQALNQQPHRRQDEETESLFLGFRSTNCVGQTGTCDSLFFAKEKSAEPTPGSEHSGFKCHILLGLLVCCGTNAQFSFTRRHVSVVKHKQS